MENKMATLFEYQRFAPNERLARIIENTERRFEPLSEEDLLWVTAAGDMRALQEAQKKAEREDLTKPLK